MKIIVSFGGKISLRLLIRVFKSQNKLSTENDRRAEGRERGEEREREGDRRLDVLGGNHPSPSTFPSTLASIFSLPPSRTFHFPLYRLKPTSSFVSLMFLSFQ